MRAQKIYHPLPAIEQLESRELLSAAPAGNLDVQRAFAGNLSLQQPLVLQISSSRHTTLRRLALDMLVSSQTTDGQIAGTLTLAHLGNFSFSGTIDRRTFQITVSDATGDSGTLAGSASAAGRQVKGRFSGSIHGLQIDGTANVTARSATSAQPASAGTAVVVPPNFNSGLFSATPVAGGVFQPGNGVITPVTGMSEPTNGFTQPLIGISMPTTLGSGTGAIAPSIGFVGSGALGSGTGVMGGSSITGAPFEQTTIM